MSIHYLRSPVLPDTTTRVRDGERRQIEKLMARATKDGVISQDEQDEILRRFRATPSVVRDVYIEAAAQLGKGGKAPVGLDVLTERLAARDAILDEATRWGDSLAMASSDGSLSSSDRAMLVSLFRGLSKDAQATVLAVLPYYNVAGVSELSVELDLMTKYAVR